MSKLNMSEKKKLAELIEAEVYQAKSELRNKSFSQEVLSNLPKQVDKLHKDYQKNRERILSIEKDNGKIEKELNELFFSIGHYKHELDVRSEHPKLEKLIEIRDLKLKQLDMLKTMALIGLYSEGGELEIEFQGLRDKISEVTK